MKKRITSKMQYKVGEVEIHYLREIRMEEPLQMLSSQRSYNFLNNLFDDNKRGHREFFYAVFLDQSLNVLGGSQIGLGGINSVTVDVRLLFQTALLMNATGIVVSHNHPSGRMEASPEDIKLTNSIKAAGATLSIKLLDHIIVGPHPDGKYFSFNDRGLL